MRLLTRPLFRRPAPPPPAAPTHGTISARCERRVEAKVRALCVLAFAGTGARLNSLHIIEPDDSVTVVVRITLTLAGPAGVALERLVDQLSREPGVRDLHWRLHQAVSDGAGTGRSLPGEQGWRGEAEEVEVRHEGAPPARR
ncbi:hypothetical protein [Streptomyces morookaense]|uniref:MgtC-like C-terminal domain-containing protein n=1 Tax=Streptomyces morookaense TaxID=1970 RepID=A0A7Y7E8C6_STRMO|nr:hypothetical protein [Streptomyces morookaense]NVK79306.1 hypothetical protein [Streptomyces morookaense]GHF43127.1 hypothetical protein GCM10010359_52200 [Streptomyces morookaense]